MWKLTSAHQNRDSHWNLNLWGTVISISEALLNLSIKQRDSFLGFNTLPSCFQQEMISLTESAKSQTRTIWAFGKQLLFQRLAYGRLRIWRCWVNNQTQFNVLPKTLPNREWRLTNSTSAPPRTSKAPICKRHKRAELSFYASTDKLPHMTQIQTGAHKSAQV